MLDWFKKIGLTSQFGIVIKFDLFQIELQRESINLM